MLSLTKIETFSDLAHHQLGNKRIGDTEVYSTVGVMLLLKLQDGEVVSSNEWLYTDNAIKRELQYNSNSNMDGTSFDNGESHVAEIYVLVESMD